MYDEALRLIREARDEIYGAENNFEGTLYLSTGTALYDAIEKALIGLAYYKTNKIPSQTLTLIQLSKLVKIPSKFNKYLKELTQDDFITQRASLGSPQTYISHSQELEELIFKAKEILEWIEEELEE